MRAKTTVGNARRASSMQALKEFLDDSKIGFRVEPISLRDARAWQLSDGALSHQSGGFFSVTGVQFDDEQGRQGIYLFQPQSALTGLLTCVLDGEAHFLLQARAEPGNPGCSQFGPTVQSTPANYLRAHGGKATPYIGLFSTYQSGVRVLHDSMQLDYGERYLFKSKRLILGQCQQGLPLEHGFIWVPARLMNQLVAESMFSTFDLRSLLVMCPWEDTEPHALRPSNARVRRGLQLPLRPEALAQVFALLRPHVARYHFCNIATMTNWNVCDHGILERESRQGFDIGYFHVQAQGREVASWSQPLVNSRSQGHASLVCRLVDDSVEVLVQPAHESGLQTGSALLPSFLRYPGAEATQPPPSGKTMLRTMESDEGGRFYRDTSCYELVLSPNSAQCDGVWLRVSELWFLLAKSNICSIQLRCLASMLLADWSENLP